MEEEITQQNKPRIWLWILIFILILILVAIGVYFLVGRTTDKYVKSTEGENTGVMLAMPDKILSSKFGFLGGGEEDDGMGVKDRGAGWVRPHPGPFVWDMMQKNAGAEISFENADKMVENFQTTELGTLATIWPFADWDQKKLVDADSCKVSEGDEFLLKNDKKGRGSYIPQYRCNPSDWTAYAEWVKAIVERYDGDGVNDMPGLKMPIKYWEAMNEPDLEGPAGEEQSLDFYKQGPTEYSELLIKTSRAIKEADPEAKVLIAGAAGGSSQFLNFYRQAFVNKETLSAFDIGNVHCISNDEKTHDFNVAAYKNMLADYGLDIPIWVTEAEAMYGSTGEQNYQNTKKSTAGALSAGAERIFFTRYTFDDFRTDMSQKTASGTYPSEQKYRELVGLY